MYINIKFTFDEKYVQERTEHDAGIDEISYSDEDIEVFDGEKIIFARKVHRTPKATGSAKIVVPSVLLEFRPYKFHNIKKLKTPIWQKIYILPNE